MTTPHPNMNHQVAKARDYFLGKIAELRRPKTHVQMVQRHGLMKYHYLYEFLAANAPEVADEVRCCVGGDGGFRKDG